MVGLGCEQTTGGYLQQHHGIVSLHAPDGTQLTRDGGIPMLTMQTEGGTRQTIAKADALLEHVLDRANQCERETADASHLSLAVECGGSDGYSGLTANPAVGVVSDRIVACGGLSVGTPDARAGGRAASRSHCRNMSSAAFVRTELPRLTGAGAG